MGFGVEMNAENAEKWVAEELAELINQCSTEVEGGQETTPYHVMEKMQWKVSRRD